MFSSNGSHPVLITNILFMFYLYSRCQDYYYKIITICFVGVDSGVAIDFVFCIFQLGLHVL
jgi:hypothetical protein